MAFHSFQQSELKQFVRNPLKSRNAQAPTQANCCIGTHTGPRGDRKIPGFYRVTIAGFTDDGAFLNGTYTFENNGDTNWNYDFGGGVTMLLTVGSGALCEISAGNGMGSSLNCQLLNSGMGGNDWDYVSDDVLTMTPYDILVDGSENTSGWTVDFDNVSVSMEAIGSCANRSKDLDYQAIREGALDNDHNWDVIKIVISGLQDAYCPVPVPEDFAFHHGVPPHGGTIPTSDTPWQMTVDGIQTCVCPTFDEDGVPILTRTDGVLVRWSELNGTHYLSRRTDFSYHYGDPYVWTELEGTPGSFSGIKKTELVQTGGLDYTLTPRGGITVAAIKNVCAGGDFRWVVFCSYDPWGLGGVSASGDSPSGVVWPLIHHAASIAEFSSGSVYALEDALNGEGSSQLMQALFHTGRSFDGVAHYYGYFDSVPSAQSLYPAGEPWLVSDPVNLAPAGGSEHDYAIKSASWNCKQFHASGPYVSVALTAP